MSKEQFHVLVKIEPKTAYPFADFKEVLEDLEELSGHNLEVKETEEGYEVTVDKQAWIDSYEGRGCKIRVSSDMAFSDMVLAKIFAEEIRCMTDGEIKVEVQVK